MAEIDDDLYAELYAEFIAENDKMSAERLRQHIRTHVTSIVCGKESRPARLAWALLLAHEACWINIHSADEQRRYLAQEGLQ